MQKWEYTVLLVMGYDRVNHINGIPQKSPYPNLHELLVQLGDEGWEVCACGDQQIILKRPK